MKKIFVAGHNGMVGSAIVRQLQNNNNIKVVVKGRKELDLLSQKQVYDFFQREKIDEIYLAAAKVGGIHANNQYPADFIYENLMIEANVIHSAHMANIQKLLFLGSSCIYPKLAKQPISEDALLTGTLEPTNEPYAVAKIAGIKLCESYNRQYARDYRSVMPTNLYGINDNFNLQNAHVVPALIRKFHDAKQNSHKQVQVWGSGKPMREFLYVDDMASACIYVMSIDRDFYAKFTDPMCSHINIGTGIDCSIKELAELISKVVGFNGDIIFDKTKPDGTPRKLLDVSKINKLGWQASISLEQGLRNTYNWYLQNQNNFRN
ncbi:MULTISPECIES: GDP-L-fucose synthase [Francisella]|uniref:GDP-L-fucose synthase n=1 Tax=Francisella opportunistica TaxID=2016517 RepID=A0A345JQP5_9GAMM|nr:MULTISPECIES: GDP-L-fucose synthase [Francisella]APC91348.1 GDP-L-fucose synthetase [Francisella sp. MA067296]AXH29641.1 GDP-L-fucose synthase [Francisella opportunistica]AXH31291.1 GDP-L-fucose synthase [Francisella opportunistica]AXH32938.1 GDP-L-fucose synthase [Francisella opportunistica]